MLLQGILLGLSLSFLIGPLLFAIVQASLEYGFRAGLAVAAGIWTGDVLYVLVVAYALEALASLTVQPGFQFWAGLAGGLLLAGFGLHSFLAAPAPPDPPMRGGVRTLDPESVEAPSSALRSPPLMGGSGGAGAAAGSWRYAAYWLRGFIINLINPFTVFFWLSIASAVVVPNRWNGQDTTVFFGGMLGTLVVTDTLKAWAAKGVRRFLTPAHIRLVQRGLGLVLLGFGLFMMVKSMHGGR